MSSVAIVLAGLGVIFIWAGVRGDDPRELFADAFRPKGSKLGKFAPKPAGPRAPTKTASNAPKGDG